MAYFPHVSPHQQEQEAFNAGFNAFMSGKSNVDNPFNDDAGLQELWNDGWFEAFDQSQEIDPAADF